MKRDLGETEAPFLVRHGDSSSYAAMNPLTIWSVCSRSIEQSRPQYPSAVSSSAVQGLGKLARSLPTDKASIGSRKGPVWSVTRADSELPLQHKVNLMEVPDYHTFVQKEKEMWLQCVAQKANRGAYTSVADFKADIQQIVTNCIAYNSPNRGINASEGEHSERANLRAVPIQQHLL